MQTRIEQANNFVLHKLPVFFVLLLSVLLTLGIGCGDDSSPLADGAAPSMVDAADAGMVDAEAESLNEDAAMPNLDGGSISAVADDLAVTARQVPVAINVLSNDSLVGEWDIVGVTEPSLGRVEITPTRELRYTPDASQPGGSTEVQYTVARRGWSETLSAKVAITILPDLGTVSGGQLYTAVDDSLEEKPQGFLWTAIRNDGSRIGGNWDSSWFLQKPNGTRVNAPFPAIDPVTGVVESWLGDFGPGNSMVGYYTILGADQKYYSVSVSWDGGDTLKELSSGVYQVYGSNASGTSVGSNIHVSPNPYSGVWLKEGGSATLVTHPNPSVISTVLYDANDAAQISH